MPTSSDEIQRNLRAQRIEAIRQQIETCEKEGKSPSIYHLEVEHAGPEAAGEAYYYAVTNGNVTSISAEEADSARYSNYDEITAIKEIEKNKVKTWSPLFILRNRPTPLDPVDPNATVTTPLLLRHTS
jgi:hypothetical protein